MTVSELIQELEYLPQDAEVTLAMQPSWPMEYSIGGAIEIDGNVFLSESSQIGYLSGEATEELGW